MDLQNEGWDNFQASIQIPEQSVGSDIVNNSFLIPLTDLIPREALIYEIKNFKTGQIVFYKIK